jgi:hypothetical protein
MWRARAAYRIRVNHTVCVLAAFARLCKKRCVRNAALAKLAAISAAYSEYLCRWRTGWYNWYDRMEADAAREERTEIRKQLMMSERDMYAHRRELIRVTQELYPFCKLWQKIDSMRRVRPAVVHVQPKKVVKGRFGALVDSDDE